MKGGSDHRLRYQSRKNDECGEGEARRQERFGSVDETETNDHHLEEMDKHKL